MAEWHRIITSPYTGSMSMSGSFNVDGDSTITGNVTINGTASVSNLIVKQIGYSSGSNQLGDAIDDIQSLYGTVVIPTGSLVVNGNMNFSGSRTIQPLTASLNTKGPTLTLLGGLAGATSGNGGDIVIKGGNGINTGNTGGDVYIQGGDRTGAQRSGDIYIGNTSGQYQIYLQGAPIFTWDGPNASNAIILRRGGSTRFLIYDDVNLTSNYYFRGGSNTINAIWDTWNSVIVKGKGTTSSTTAFQVQNSAATSLFELTDNGQINMAASAGRIKFINPNSGASGNGIFWGLSATGTTYGSITLSSGGGQLDYDTNTSYFHRFLTLGGTEVMRIGTGYTANIGIRTATPQAGLHIATNTVISGSTGTNTLSIGTLSSGSALTVYKSGSTVLDVQGSSGQLFSVTDSLTGSLFSVNTVAGLPVIEAFSDNTVNIGKYGTYPIKVVSLGTSAIITGSFSGSLAGVANTASFALTASYVNPLTQSVSISGSLSNIGSFNSSGGDTLLTIGSGTYFQLAGAVGGTLSYTYAEYQGAYYYAGFRGSGNVGMRGTGTGNRVLFGNDDTGTGIVLFGNNTGLGLATPTAKLHVRGTGATSSTTSLLVQNSSAVSMLQVRDDNYTLFGPNGLGIDNFNCILYRSSFNAQSISFHLSRLSFADATGFVFSNSYSSTPAASAIFDIQSTAKGFLLPRTNITSNISAPAQGLMTYVTASATEGLYYYNSGSYQSWTKVLNSIGTQTITGSLSITGSAGTGSALTVYKSGSTVMSIQGSQGELFSITDSLSGSLFSVSNISGLPILEVFSDNTVLLGSYLDPMLITTQRLTANSGSTVIYSLPTASYDGVFVDYVIRSGSNARAGQFMGMWSGSSTNVVDSSTTDFGDTSGFVLALVVSGSNMVVTGSASTSAWTVRAGIRSI